MFNAVDFWKVFRMALAAGLTAFLLINISRRLNQPVDNITIVISKLEDGKELIDEKEIRDLLKFELGYALEIAALKELKIEQLEMSLIKNSRIDDADIYLDKNGILVISVSQKKPIVRIDQTNADDYYLDYKGTQIPVTETFRVPVVTGHVDGYQEAYKEKEDNNLNAVLELARKVHDDIFLSALVEQIHIDSKDELTIVPKVGRDKILIGEVEDLDEKIYKLKIYYEKGIKNIGLEKFDELDLKYKGQIIGRQKDT